ncbi:alpha/beta fold hydrolase [Halobacterium jilantaiense]|uniref:Pimeloyl-ACP methyl ester carboxylesterase n=1 Tax=Halobacterium jilantaiense TaxID=355548 RepID=A0A1I0NEJ3_9EURY|nr:alpha/beta hydrolase [Halobacterium jilantaiense]SEV99692.1 Pimeloyl-ACP methyl ester carboxylesterase [Halobacterium jilantaiense]
MRLRRLLAGAAAGVAATAGANRLLRARVGDLDPALDGDQGTYHWRGFDIAYTEAGDPEHPDVVLLHGVNAAASSREFGEVFDALAEDYHVLAPDLPGFGRSDRPPVAYTSKLYEQFVADFVTDTAEDAVVVASSLTGSWAAMAADEADLSGLVLVCPTADTGQRRPVVRRLLRTPVVGSGLFNALTSRRGLEWFNDRDAFYRTENVPEGLVDYQYTTSHQPGARFAPASFAGSFLDPNVDLADTLAGVDAPVTLVWGREAKITPLSEGHDLADDADVRLVVLDDTSLLPHAEQPDSFLEAVRDELPALERH